MTLAEFIITNLEPILEKWDEFAQEIFKEHHLDPKAARDHAKGLLEAVAVDLHTPQTPKEQFAKSRGHAPPNINVSEAELHGAARFAEGFSVNDEVAEFRAIRACVLQLWNDSDVPKEATWSIEQQRFNEAIDQVLAESIKRFSASKEHENYLFETLLSSTPDINYIIGLDGRFLYVNRAYASLHGLSPKELVGKNLFDLSDPNAAEFQRRVDEVIASGKTYRGDLPCFHLKGKEVIYEYILVPVIKENGTIEALVGGARDMTERKLLENALAAEKSISDMIIESSPGAFFLIDQEFKLVRWNHFMSTETGLSDEQLRGHPLLLTIVEEDRAMAAAKFLSAFATGYASMEVHVLTPRHGIRVFSKTARRIQIDGVPYLAGYCLDVTERTQIETALLQEKIFSTALVESVPGAFFVVDAEGNYFRWNDYLKNLTGLSDNELAHRPSLLSIEEAERPLAANTMRKAFESGYAQADLHVLTHDHGARPFFMTSRRFQVADSNYLVGVGVDTTEWLEKMRLLEQKAWTDPLTQISNRGHFLELATDEFARSRRYGHPFSVWMMDIDHFKNVNDTHGHQSGDLALLQVVQTSQQALRDWDILGRMGGEEFAVLLPETEIAQAQTVAERLRNAVANTSVNIGNAHSVQLTISIGVAAACKEDTDVAMLLDRADQALYEAKHSGRDRVCLAMNQAS
ncbi:MAG: diguanylate cyclase [Burkholderiaceae bacterium]